MARKSKFKSATNEQSGVLWRAGDKRRSELP
jgi:hypothetical protein